MTPEEIAARFEFSRPGFTFAGYQELSLPIFRLKLRCLVMERKPLNTIHEFVLRALRVPLTATEHVQGLLGLPDALVRAVLSDLVRTGSVQLAPSGEGRTHGWTLTAEGRRVLEDAEQVVPEEVSLEVDFDGLTHQAMPGRYLDRPRDVAAKGSVEVPAAPNRRPELAEVPLHGVADIVGAIQRGAPRRDLIDILRVDGAERLYQDAVALVFRGDRAGATQVAIALDGRPSDAHEVAFAKAKLPARLGMDVFKEEELPAIPGVGAISEIDQQSRELRRRRALAEAKVEAVRLRLGASDSPERKNVELELGVAEEEAAAAKQAQQATTVRALSVYEHRPFLFKALTDAIERVLIVSPWLHPSALNRDLMDSIARACQRGVRVYIGYGIAQEDDRRNKQAEARAEQDLRRLAASTTTLKLARFGDTHAKVLAWDRTCVVNTSFNWLSFKGTSDRGFRDERGIAAFKPELVEQQFVEYLARFEDSPSQP